MELGQDDRQARSVRIMDGARTEPGLSLRSSDRTRLEGERGHHQIHTDGEGEARGEAGPALTH